MNRVCTVCERYSADGNLWCERRNCPVDELRPIFEYGEQFGEFKIIRLVRLLPTAMLYEAEQQGEPVLIKIAHQGLDDFIKLEAALALKIDSQAAGFLHLRTAYKASTVATHPYGKAVFDRRAYYYTVYDHIQGEFLEDMLLKNPMPWYRDAAWIVIQVARSLSELHQHANIAHAAPLRSALLIKFDHNAIPRPTLVDFGWLMTIGSQERPRIVLASSLPPEFHIPNTKVSAAADVYSLARLLSEMLSGYKKSESGTNLNDRDASLVDVLGRADLPQSDQVGAILKQALAADPRQRHQSIPEFATQIISIFGKPPPYTRPTLFNALTKKADWGVVAFGGMLSFLLFIIFILAVNR